MPDEPVATAACEWCGRAIEQDAAGRWYAVKGKERGYDPLICDAVDDSRHSPDQPEAAEPTWNHARYSPATAWPAEGARVGLCTCLDCGVAIFLSMDAPALTLHDAWHDQDRPPAKDNA